MRFAHIYYLIIFISLSGCSNIIADNPLAGGAVITHSDGEINVIIKSGDFSFDSYESITVKDIMSYDIVTPQRHGKSNISFINDNVPSFLSELDITLFNMALNAVDVPIKNIVLVPVDEKNFIYEVTMNRTDLPETIYFPISNGSDINIATQMGTILHELTHLATEVNLISKLTQGEDFHESFSFYDELIANRIGLCYRYIFLDITIANDINKQQKIKLTLNNRDIAADYYLAYEELNYIMSLRNFEFTSLLAAKVVSNNLNNLGVDYCLFFAPKYYQGMKINDWYQSEINKRHEKKIEKNRK
ncbi:hypothetical protein [Shewanella sp. NIFS-20-20]|uniref:hypothetical protein n=1 Tax=Shewanella sp. NIFS-20-20 TaxID=2853806 RepID=UPI001C47FD3C|nr:hypothetical protein [Shewanella sp. NIFS-20-20]MBV7315530.1 hypothetical protein [Shewanella sp. NIFS-20-20]